MDDSYYINLFMHEFVKTLGQITGVSVSTLVMVPMYMYYNKVGLFAKKKD